MEREGQGWRRGYGRVGTGYTGNGRETGGWGVEMGRRGIKHIGLQNNTLSNNNLQNNGSSSII